MHNSYLVPSFLSSDQRGGPGALDIGLVVLLWFETAGVRASQRSVTSKGSSLASSG